MTQPFSIRFRQKKLLARLKEEAARDTSTSALAEQLIDEGLRTGRHPLIVFRDGASGRRAEFTEEIDEWFETNARLADEAEALGRKRNDLLAR